MCTTARWRCVLIVGHLYLALLHPATRHALRGMTLGDVDADWARGTTEVGRAGSARPTGMKRVSE